MVRMHDGAAPIFIKAAVAKAVTMGYDGYNFDNELRGSVSESSWEYLKPYSAHWLAFLEEFADALHAVNKTLSVDIAGCCGVSQPYSSEHRMVQVTAFRCTLTAPPHHRAPTVVRCCPSHGTGYCLQMHSNCRCILTAPPLPSPGPTVVRCCPSRRSVGPLCRCICSTRVCIHHLCRLCKKQA
jgi:hypothetical protein